MNLIFNTISIDDNKKITTSFNEERPAGRKFITSYDYVNDEKTISAEWGLTGYSSVQVYYKYDGKGEKSPNKHPILGDVLMSNFNWSAIAGDECFDMWIFGDIDGIFEKLKGFCK